MCWHFVEYIQYIVYLLNSLLCLAVHTCLMETYIHPSLFRVKVKCLFFIQLSAVPLFHQYPFEKQEVAAHRGLFAPFSIAAIYTV